MLSEWCKIPYPARTAYCPYPHSLLSPKHPLPPLPAFSAPQNWSVKWYSHYCLSLYVLLRFLWHFPTSESALPNNNTDQENKQEGAAEDTEGTEEDTESTEELEEKDVPEQESPMISYVLMGVLAVAFIGGAYYFKVVRKKKEDFIEDEDEDEEDNEEYENEDEESEESPDDDFFEEQEGE